MAPTWPMTRIATRKVVPTRAATGVHMDSPDPLWSGLNDRVRGEHERDRGLTKHDFGRRRGVAVGFHGDGAVGGLAGHSGN
ncbi:hypothetical protein E2562_000888 [Oryza meyeriana var. granulata]|uniref:Uncharacterized protein n=1 Tax=Oryza meyeriana var. granulata TaxID=110450 RepID=A0A6G1CYT3_9ORYZ|nr:hypothetical protein E2562_000888 [Oryza meyeriana var. granulata]